jgi:hypothetical protein
MHTTMESGFEWPVPSSIKLDGFHCYRRGGCDRGAFCEGKGECLGVDPPLANALSRFDEIAGRECLGVEPPPLNAFNRNSIDETAEIERPGIPSLAKTSSRNRVDELAAKVRALTYAEMLEFARGLWGLRGKGEVNSETLPKILYAWATGAEPASDCAVPNEPAPPAGECDCREGKKFQPIDTAPKDRPILAFMLGRWRIARWKPNHPHKRPIPFWSADDLRVTVSRAHQPMWWAEFPPSPPEAESSLSPASQPESPPQSAQRPSDC